MQKSGTMFRLAIVFCVSGAAGLFYEVIFSKSLALTFGSTAVAATTVLATYMGGISLGSWVGGKIAPARPVRAYALCEIGVGAWCALSGPMQHWLRSAYVGLAAGSEPGTAGSIALKVALGSVALLPPTVLMGMTLPLLVRDSLGRGKGLGDAVGVLYGANTLGAALGALLAGYVVLPLLGVSQTTLLAVALNLLAALVGLRIAQVAGPGETPAEAPAAQPAPVDARLGRAALAVLTLGGAITLSLETVYIHLLAVVAGNSVFAFSLMLFAFLIGLGGGSALGRRRVLRSASLGRDLALCELGLSAVLLAGVFYWDRLPLVFLAKWTRPLAGSFGGRELVRFVSCASAMLPPALLIGVAYPIAMELVGRAWPGQRVLALGRAAALNTLGNIAGALIGGFALLPLLGSLRSLHLLAAVALLIALLPAAFLVRREQLQAGAGALCVLALFALQPKSFDLRRLASGANVYFSPQDRGAVIDHAESLDGGLTTVHVGDAPPRVLTLNTNGKFQGNDSGGGEMRAQIGFALDTLLHSSARDRALVIGFGTGTTTRVIAASGFERVDVAELSGDILHLADRNFRKVNGGVLANPKVHAHVTDGRNMLLLSSERYDVISMEISSIWFAGAASLYNRDYYRIAKDHLTASGVLQQWLQLHHLLVEDLVSVIASMRAEFPQVWFYLTGEQGILVGCMQDCPESDENAQRIDNSPLRRLLASAQMSAAQQRRDRLLTPADVDKMLDEVRAHADYDSLISTDDNLRLEYSTPRGNVLPGPESLEKNLRYLSHFASPLPPEQVAR